MASRNALLATLARCRPAVLRFLNEFRHRQEWEVSLFWDPRWINNMAGHVGPPAPHFFAAERTSCGSAMVQTAPPLVCEDTQTLLRKTLRAVERHLAAKAEHFCRIQPLPRPLTGRDKDMVFNAAVLLSPALKADWLQTIGRIRRKIGCNGLLLEASGPWPLYHFTPRLEL
jgi:hypothetical protein